MKKKYYVSENMLSIKCYPNNPIKMHYNIKNKKQFPNRNPQKHFLIYYTKTLSQKQITKIVFNKNKKNYIKYLGS